MEQQIRKRKPYPTMAQKERLISLLEADDELRSGKFSNSFTRKVAEERWASISMEVNSIPGAHKTWVEWRKTWQDMRSKVKKRHSEIRQHTSITGGGPPPEPLNSQEINILNTISQPALVGHEDSQESIVMFEDLDQQKSFRANDPENNTDVMLHNTATIEAVQSSASGSSENKENKPKKRKHSALKRLENSQKTANDIKESLQQKIRIKTDFYNQFLELMKLQTVAIQQIAESLKKDTNNK